MKTTDYAGIDYSPIGSNVNRDIQSGIRYGVISQHSLNHDATEDIWQNGEDLTFKAYQDEAKAKLRHALEDYFSEHKWGDEKTSKLDDAVEEAFEAIEQGISDAYQPDNAQMLYEREGYVIQTCLDTDFFVSKSPYFTFAQFCSPCVPGACNLDSPLDPAVWPDANKCYCLGHDWFEDNKAPYPIFSVETGTQVNPE